MPKLIKKILVYLLVFIGISYGYQFITGKSIATLPGELVKQIQNIGSTSQTESTNPRYHKDPAKYLSEDRKEK